MYIYMHGLKEDTLFEFIRTCSIRSTSPISCELITCHIWYFAGLAAWENDYRHHRCLKISRNCYETWSLQETMVTAQKFAWSQLGAGNSNIFFGKFHPKDLWFRWTQIWRPRIYFSDRLVQLKPSTSCKWRLQQIQLGLAKRTKRSQKNAWKNAVNETFCGWKVGDGFFYGFLHDSTHGNSPWKKTFFCWWICLTFFHILKKASNKQI